VLLAVILLAAARGRGRNRIDTIPESPLPSGTAEIPISTPAAESTGASTTEIPDWLKPADEEDPFQTVRLEEAGLAQVFEQDHEVDLAATPPRGLRLDDNLSQVNVEPAGEIVDELTDEDMAAISAQDFSTRMPQPGATAFIDESVVTGDFTELTAEDQAWLEAAPGADLDEASWLDTPAIEEAAAEEPTPEEMAPFEGEAPSFVAPPAEANLAAELPEADIDETPDETYAKFSQDIAYVAGVGQDEAARLRAIGITVPLLLLKRGATPEGRQQIAEQANLDPDALLKWVHDVDLFRVKGVDREFAALLEASGVNTIADLAGSNIRDLYEHIREAAAYVPDLRRLPSQGTVEGWIAQAKKLPRSVS
jgi:predicted flap endonuclease-1-like 5' DNA nuclease